MTIDEETADIELGDGVPVRLHEAHGFYNTAQSDLELMVIGVALEKGKFDATDVPQDLSK